MKKTFVLDTNVLLHSPVALTAFEDNRVVIPIEALEDLDKFKSSFDEKGRNARLVIRKLDLLRRKGSLREGVELENKGLLQVVGNVGREVFTSINLNPDVGTNRLIATAYWLSKNGGEKVIFVSKDINARVKADVLGILSEDFEKEKVDFDTLWTGWKKQKVGSDVLDKLAAKKEIAADFLEAPTPNEYFFLSSDKQAPDAPPLVARYDLRTKKLKLVAEEAANVWGIQPKNAEQIVAFDLLLNDDIKLVSLMGQAGTGKTLLALAVGLRKTIDEAVYHRILVSRPIIPFGKDIGYLPGSKTEKIVNWMQPIYDNVSYILDGYKKKGHGRDFSMDYLMEAEFLELEPITYMRGRSIPRQYLIIDEAQNLTPREMKTIVTRAGNGTKMILTGDPQQIDNPYLDEDSNGLSFLVSRFRGQAEFGHVQMTHSERSKLASLAADLL